MGSSSTSSGALYRIKALLWYPPASRVNSRPGAYSSGFPWKIMYYRQSVVGALVLLGGMIGAQLSNGLAALLGFSLGFLIAYICFTLSVVTVVVAEKLKLSVPKALVIGYVVKIVLMTVVLVTLHLPQELRSNWVPFGAVVSTVLWLGIESWTIMTTRFLYFDSEDRSS